MSAATHAGEQKSASPDVPSPEEITEQLRQLLASSTFHGSKRCQQFLEYVCEKSLAGETGALKERSIALDVFGRHLDAAGHTEDTIVRVSAREVRKRLTQFYATAEGAASAISIVLPSGSYAPEFHYLKAPEVKSAVVVGTLPELAPTVEGPSTAKNAPEKVAGRVRFWGAAAGVGVLLVSAGIAVVRWSSTDPQSVAFEKFWDPVFHSSEPLLVGVGHPLVYQPSHRASQLSERRLPEMPFPVQRALEIRPEELNGSDIVPVFNQFVGFGDMVAANEVSQMLAHRSRSVRLMMASSIPFSDLRQSQTYLIGSLSNHWTMELGQNWRFRFGWTADFQPEFIDTLPGTKREWRIPSQDNGSTPEDYSMICRIPNSPTGKLLIVSAGIKQFGTEAAGRILSDPAALGTILNKLPPGWQDKNVQLILHMKVIGNTPAQPDLVAAHVW